MRRYLFFYYFLQESARDKTQKFKEGKFILDRFYSSKLLFISYAREKYKKKSSTKNLLFYRGMIDDGANSQHNIDTAGPVDS